VRRIHLLGFPGDVGGASTECWHTLKLWRAHGADVTLTPTWSASPEWIAKVEGIGCKVATATVKTFSPGPGVPVVSMCNSQFWPVLKRLARQGKNPTVWVPCMNWLAEKEKRRYAQGFLPSAIVCQSGYQRGQLARDLGRFGLLDRVVRIRGPFDASEIPFRPKARGEEFVVGRISRAAHEKFRPDIWRVLGEARERLGGQLRARVLGWRPLLAARIGSPPPWVEVLEPGAVDVREFLGSLDCLYQSGTTDENWPRVGLEAMAAGVPIVADDRGGWREMAAGLAHLVGDTEASVDAICRVATESQAGLIAAARHAVETRLGNDGLWSQWEALFQRIAQ